jgi:hypothetical protein
VKRPYLLLLGLLFLACDGVPRGVTPGGPSRLGDLDGPFDPAASAGVFVGVQKYSDVALTRVQFGADDAVDLAHHLVLVCKLIPPQRAVVAITGSPLKEQSKTRRQELRNAGVLFTEATDVLGHVRRLAKPNGLMVLSFAGHGFSKEGTPYLATSGARLDDPETWLSASAVLDEVAKHSARSLVLLDACRERVEESRGVVPSSLSIAPAIAKMSKAQGQVVLYAAPAGGYAYDDMVRRNGVFTAAVIGGLQCGTRTSPITADQLSVFVANRVRDWVRRNKDPRAMSVMQFSMDDRAKKMPLLSCHRSGRTVPVTNPAIATIDGRKLTASTRPGKPLFTHTFREPITQVEVADLDGDKVNEVVTAVGNVITVFEANGAIRKAADLGARIRKFDVDKVLRGESTEQIVAIANGVHQSRVVILNRLCNLEAMWVHPRELRGMLITKERPTAHLRRILVSTLDEVVLLDPKQLQEALWRAQLPSAKITDVTVGHRHVAADQYSIEVRTTSGPTYLDFKGRKLGRSKAGFQLFAPR